MDILKIKLRQKVMVPLLVVLGLLTATVVYTQQRVEFGKLSEQHQKMMRRVEWMLDKKYDESAEVYDILTREVFQDPVLQQAFLAGDRDALLEQARVRYNSLNQEYGVTHFYFHRPDKTCFLRVHEPSRFGDTIDRHTLNVAMRQDKPYYGIELGPLGTLTLRYVRPWHVDGRLVGYVELGTDIEGIIESVKDETGLELAVMVDKNFLNRFDWEEGLEVFGKTRNWNLLEESVIASSGHENLIEPFLEDISKNCFREKACSDTLRFKNEKKTYLGGCFGLLSADSINIGRMIVISDISDATAVIAQSSLFFGVMCLAAGTLASVFFYFHIGQIEQRVKEIHHQQAIEIMHRRFAEAQINEAKTRAEDANKTKSEFMANMSHELRTPMNAIMGFSELLKEESLNHEQMDYVETIYASSKHLLTLINDVLDIAKIESGKLEINMERCSLKHLLSQVDSLMHQAAESKGLTFKVEIDPSLPEEMMTDAKHLYQCLINLVGNAIKFTSEGHVIIRATAIRNIEISHVRFEIEDTGIGIPRDKQSLVFESFRQADSSTCRKYGGTGLGLSISRQLIELMGGTLMLSSEDGSGSVFTIMLPYESAQTVKC